MQRDPSYCPPSNIQLDWACVERKPEAHVIARLGRRAPGERASRRRTPTVLRFAQGTVSLTLRIEDRPRDGQSVALFTTRSCSAACVARSCPSPSGSLTPPKPGRSGEIAGFAIESRRGTGGDLFSLTWTRPARPADGEAAERRFIRCPQPERLPLYVELLALSKLPDAARS